MPLILGRVNGTSPVKISIHDLAKRVGMSAATVSRVMNNRHRVNDQTRQRVLEAAREAGFRPRVSSRATTVGVVIDWAPEFLEVGGGLVQALALGVSAALAHHRLAVEIFTRGNLGTLQSRFLDGVLAIAWEPESLAAITALENVPAVIFNRPEYPTLSNVQLDEVEVGRLAARHLIERGHTHLGVIYTDNAQVNLSRLDGYRQEMAAAGLSLPHDHVGSTLVLPSYATVQRLLRAGVTGLFMMTDELTAEVPYLCGEVMQMSLPKDLSLVGVGLAASMKYSRPPMTLIAPPYVAMADAAVSLLNDLIGSQDRTRREIVLKPELVVRDSVTRPQGTSA